MAHQVDSRGVVIWEGIVLVCCIIKPPTLAWNPHMVAHFRRQEIPVVAQKKFVYTRHAIEVLYDHMDDTVRSGIAERYCGRTGLAVLLDFKDIEHCLDCIGRESDPDACASHSIRAMYCAFAAPERLGGILWWENGIHRPIDEQERVRDPELVFPEHYMGAA